MKPKPLIAILVAALLFLVSLPIGYAETGFLLIGAADQNVEVPATIYVYGVSPSSINFKFQSEIEPPYPYCLEVPTGYYNVRANYTKLDGTLAQAGWNYVEIRDGSTATCAIGTYKFTDDNNNDIPWVSLSDLLEWFWLNILLPFWWWILLLLLLLLLFIMLSRKEKKKKKR